jgi:hypothetical protein
MSEKHKLWWGFNGQYIGGGFDTMKECIEDIWFQRSEWELNDMEGTQITIGESVEEFDLDRLERDIEDFIEDRQREFCIGTCPSFSKDFKRKLLALLREDVSFEAEVLIIDIAYYDVLAKEIEWINEKGDNQ